MSQGLIRTSSWFSWASKYVITKRSRCSI